jgi:glycosyltransferase involved in cell wall biosynthesis
METVRHGAHIRPYEICKGLDVPLSYAKTLHTIPPRVAEALVKGETLLLFPGYSADQLILLLIYLAKFRRCKLLLDVADIPYLQYKFFQGDPSSKSMSDFAKLLDLSDVLFFSTASLEGWTAGNFDVSRKRNYIVENASDPTHFKFTPLPQKKVILFVGGYIPARGVDELIEAFQILRKRGNDCTLKLAGFGYPESISGDGIEINQSVFYDQIPQLFESSYVFVIPHRPNLYMRLAAPIKLFDAMAAGRPIVSTPCDETIAVIKKENCGVVSGVDPPSMADTIEDMLENPDKASQLGFNGRKAIEERYSWGMRANQIREIIENN